MDRRKNRDAAFNTNVGYDVDIDTTHYVRVDVQFFMILLLAIPRMRFIYMEKMKW